MKTMIMFVLVMMLGVVADVRAQFSIPSVLIVVTSHDQIDEGHPTGLWLEEFAIPYEMFRQAGLDILVASVKGGKAPLDPRSLKDKEKFSVDTLTELEYTTPLREVVLGDHAAVFFPGGHGTMYDFPSDKRVAEAVSHFIEKGLPTALVCHGPAALVGATLADGTPVVNGRRVTGFTNEEEKAVDLYDKMPFLLETKLAELGGEFVGADNFVEHVIVDGNLITGQNPASSEAAARALIEQLLPGRR